MRRATWAGILSALCAGLAWLFWPGRVVLEVADLSAGRVALCAAMAEDEAFVLRFIHSVNRRPVFDTLRVARDHVTIVKSRYDALGGGMPDATTEQGTLSRAADGWLEWTVNRSLPEVVVRVGRVADQTLLLKGREIPLAALAEAGAPLVLRGGTRSLFSLWKGRCIR
jgi:hypothetical protein